MSKIKALIIDNDILVRRFFFNILNSIDDVEVQVLYGHENLQSVLSENHFDVVFLNVDGNEGSEKVELNVLQTAYPNLNIVATAERSKSGGDAIIDALNNEVVDFVTTPEEHNAMLLANRHFRKRLSSIIENIRYFKAKKERKSDRQRKHIFSRQRAKIVVIGAGAEGIKTLYTVFRKLPGNLAAPILIVSHLPKTYTRILAESLNEISDLSIAEAKDGVKLVAGTAWVIPGGLHAEVSPDDHGYSIRLHRGQRENEVRPSLDVTFRSVARLFGKSALGVFISGCGEDGFKGAKQIKEHGGQIILAQSEAIFAGKLLDDIYEAGLCNQVCTEEYLSWEIMKRARLTKKKSSQSSIVAEGVPSIERGAGF